MGTIFMPIPALNNTWLGYDVPFDNIENHPDVKQFRSKGIKKRVATSEHHVTIVHFENIDPEKLRGFLLKAEGLFGNSLARAAITFDGSGTLKQPEGDYVYLALDPQNGQEAWFLKKQFQSSEMYDVLKNCPDLHLSVGGPDPFTCPKPRLEDLSKPLTVHGRLVMVGHDGKTGFHRYLWDSAKQDFVEIELAKQARPGGSGLGPPANRPQRSEDGPGRGKSTDRTRPMPSQPLAVNTIAIFPKIQADTATAIYLLKSFGERAFPGIQQAPIAFWTAIPAGQTAQEIEAAGTLLVDLGGRFDHHLANERSGKREDCVSTLIAKHLGVDKHPALKKLLAWAKRDDLEGKGTVSADSLDRAFGLSGIIMNLNREYNAAPNRVLDVVLPILDAHVREEIRRTVELPKEWDEMQKSGKAELLNLRQGNAEIAVAAVQSDNIALPGFLRAAKQVDFIIQRRSTGHTNIITKQDRSIDLRPIIEGLRVAEATARGFKLDVPRNELQGPGRVGKLEMWYYDTAGNTIQNGGVSPEGVDPTKLSFEQVVQIVKDTLPRGVIGALKREKERTRT
jgi:hypothetical protein